MVGCAVKLRRAQGVIRGQSGFFQLSFPIKVSINICCVVEACVPPLEVGGVGVGGRIPRGRPPEAAVRQPGGLLSVLRAENRAASGL